MTNTWNIENLDPIRMVDDEKVKAAFLRAYTNSQQASQAEAEAAHARESIYWRKAVSGNENLQRCTKISLYGAFLDAAITGLSMQPGQKSEAYLEARASKIGNSYITTATFVLTAYGELNMRIRAGQIKRMQNPIVLYEGDHFQPMTNNRGELYVEYKPAIPRKPGAKVYGAFVTIHLPDGGLDFKWLLTDDIERLKKYSAKGFKGNPNALYSSNEGGIDIGFLETKCIKHAMRAYTKLRIGQYVSYEDDIDTDKAEPFHGDAAENHTQAQAQAQAQTNGAPKLDIPTDDGNDIF